MFGCFGENQNEYVHDPSLNEIRKDWNQESFDLQKRRIPDFEEGPIHQHRASSVSFNLTEHYRPLEPKTRAHDDWVHLSNSQPNTETNSAETVRPRLQMRVRNREMMDDHPSIHGHSSGPKRSGFMADYLEWNRDPRYIHRQNHRRHHRVKARSRLLRKDSTGSISSSSSSRGSFLTSLAFHDKSEMNGIQSKCDGFHGEEWHQNGRIIMENDENMDPNEFDESKERQRVPPLDHHVQFKKNLNQFHPHPHSHSHSSSSSTSSFDPFGRFSSASASSSCSESTTTLTIPSVSSHTLTSEETNFRQNHGHHRSHRPRSKTLKMMMDIDDESNNPGEFDTPPTHIHSSHTIKPITPWPPIMPSNEMIHDLIGPDMSVPIYRDHLFRETLNHPEWFNPHASHLQNRSKVLQWMFLTGLDLQLQRETIYRAIYYFDRLCSENVVNRNHLQISSAVCLLIATKWTEREDKVPTLSDLFKYCGGKHSINDFKEIEIRILNLLNWDLKFVLGIDLIDFWIYHGPSLLFVNDSLDGHEGIHKHPDGQTYLRKFALFFFDLISQDYSFWKYPMKLLSASVVIASRRALRIRPCLNPSLLSVLDLESFHPIRSCLMKLWADYQSKYPDDFRRAEKGEKDAFKLFHERESPETPLVLTERKRRMSIDDNDDDNDDRDDGGDSDMKWEEEGDDTNDL